MRQTPAGDLVRLIRESSRPLEPLPSELPARPMPIDGIDVVLFDVYGTLLISASGDIGVAAEGRSAGHFADALKSAGYEGELERAAEIGPAALHEEIERRHRAARARGIDHPEVEITEVWPVVLRRLRERGFVTSGDDAERRERLAVEYEIRANPVWPMPGASETFAALRASGRTLGIVSNAQFYTPLALEALFGRGPTEMGFDPALCVWSHREGRAKPSVELFRGLSSRIDLSRALYVGNDMLNDVWTAGRAGCRTVLFAGDGRSLRLRRDDPRCAGLTPDAVVDDLRSVPELITRGRPSRTSSDTRES